MYCYTHCPQPSIRPPLTHASAGDSWTVPGKSGSDLLKLQPRFNLFLLFSLNSRGYLPPLSLISDSQNNTLSLLYNIFALHGSFTWMFWGVGIQTWKLVFLSVNSWVSKVTVAYTYALFWCQFTDKSQKSGHKSGDGRKHSTKAVLEPL